MPYLPFIFGVLALLLTPGPTNTLLAMGAASQGLRKALPLALAEITAYLIVVTLLATLAAGLFAAWPGFAAALKVGAAAWIMYLAVRLWFPQAQHVAAVSVQHVFVTTLLNPKAIIIGLVLMPHGALFAVLPHLVLLAGLILFASLCWLSFGTFVLGGGTGRIDVVQVRKVAAVILAGFSVMLTGSLFS